MLPERTGGLFLPGDIELSDTIVTGKNESNDVAKRLLLTNEGRASRR